MVRNHAYAWGWCFSHIIKMRKRKMFCFTSVALNSLRGSALDVRGNDYSLRIFEICFFTHSTQPAPLQVTRHCAWNKMNLLIQYFEFSEKRNHRYETPPTCSNLFIFSYKDHCPYLFTKCWLVRIVKAVNTGRCQTSLTASFTNVDIFVYKMLWLVKYDVTH